MTETLPVVIAGAGPGGLALAVALAEASVPVVLLERDAELAYDLRAGSYHPPTIEIFDRLGIGETMREKGLRVDQWQVRDRREGVVAEFDLGLLRDDTPYPFRLHCEQHKLTPVLLERLRGYPHADVRLGTAFVAARQFPGHVEATLRGPDGEETMPVAWLVGADGAHSTVRAGLAIEFEGFTWPQRYLVASTLYDLAQHGFAMNAYIADPVEWCAVFKMPHDGPPGLWRLAFPVDADTADDEALSPAFVNARLAGFVSELDGQPVPYVSIYRVHQRVANTFRQGRILLLGDAAHVNNPLGGMGLNSAIHDAMNLAEKLVAIRNEEADADTLLDRYVRQRRQVNIDFVQAMSIRNKRLLEERDAEVRRAHLDELRATAEDPERARAHLLNTSMIASMRRAEAIQ